MIRILDPTETTEGLKPGYSFPTLLEPLIMLTKKFKLFACQGQSQSLKMC